MILKRIPIPSVILLIVCLLAMPLLSGCIESEADADQPGASECDFIKRFFLGYAMLGDDELEILPGDIPESLADEIPVPVGGRIIGSMGDGSNDDDSVHIIMDVPGAPDEALSAYSDQLMQTGGWQQTEGVHQGEFGHCVATATFCREGQGAGTLQITSMPSQDPGLADVRLALTNYGPCSASSAHQPDRPLDPLSRLQLPEGARWLNGGSSSDVGPTITLDDNPQEAFRSISHQSWIKLESEMNLTDLQSYYQQQMEFLEWIMLERIDGTSVTASVWSFIDEQDSQWQGLMTISEVGQRQVKAILFYSELIAPGKNAGGIYGEGDGWSSVVTTAVPRQDDGDDTSKGEEGCEGCSSEMGSPVVVEVDMNSKTVIAISEVELLELTDAEKERAIDLAKTSSMVQLDEANMLSTEVYPAFVSGTVATDIGEITLLPGPRMAIVEFELKSDGTVVRARVNLDMGYVTEVLMEGSEGGMAVTAPRPNGAQTTADSSQSSREMMQEEGRTKAIELVSIDPMGQSLLNRGFIIERDHIWVVPRETYLESDGGETIVVSTPTYAYVQLQQGDTVWRVTVDLIEGRLDWTSAPDVAIRHNPQLDAQAREIALNALSTFNPTAELLEADAKPYVALYHRLDYVLSEDGSVVGISVLKDNASVWLIRGDDLWAVGVDVVSGQVGNFREFPPELHLSAEEKELVLSVIKAEPEVAELLETGAEVIHLSRNEKGDSEHGETRDIGMAWLHLEGTNDFWTAKVLLEAKTFVHLTSHLDLD